MTFVFIFTGMNIAVYAIIFSLCQVLNIAGSCFLSTPKGHLKAMKKKERLIPSILYIAMIIITIVLAITVNARGVVIISVIILTLCYYWYTIAFLPCGTTILKKSCSCCFDL
jgi:hypothetical protein